MARINKLGIERLYSSSPGELVEGFINVENNGSDITLDVLWSYGFISGEDFQIYGFVISEGVTFLGQTSWTHRTGSFTTPSEPGTWDLMGVLADDITFDGSTINITGQQAIGTTQGEWTILGLGGLEVISVGVGSN